MKSSSRKSLVFAAALGLSASVSATELSPSARTRLDSAIDAIANDPRHPLASLSVLAVKNGEIVYTRQTGYRYIDLINPANSQPATTRTLYRIASISKLVTALGVMKLVEEGRLDLDADVGAYLGYPLRNPHFPDAVITLRLLMSHTSSLRDEAGYNFDYRLPLKDVLLRSGAQYGAGAAWSADHGPGYFSYVNLNWGVIGTVMERASGERFDRLMQRLILAPLGLHGGFNAAEFSSDDLANLATLYRKRVEVDRKEIWRPEGPWVAQTDDYSVAPPAPRAGADYAIGSNGTVFGPQGSLRISAEDLGKIMLMLMQRGRYGGQQILQPASIETMFAEQWRTNSSGSNGENYRGLFNAWGLGNQHVLDVSAAGSGDRQVEDGSFSGKGHTGDAWGLTSAFTLDFAKKDGMIFMIGGPGFDPETTPGRYSGKYRYEELILDALYRGGLRRE